MINLKDALQDRSLVDRWGFVGFAGVGAVLIWVLKQETGLAVEYLAAGAVALMALYAWIVSSRGTGKLRADQAGDNCYYLGLIYTLVSLSHAIFTFDPIHTATTIVQGFGIALLTTIFGLVLRVFFNQSRVDLHEVEDTARLELAEAAGRLKTQLAQITNNFRDFAFGVQQSLDELRQVSTNSISEAARASVAGIQEIAATAGQGLQSQSAAFAEQSGEVGKASRRSVAAMEKHVAVLEDLTARQTSAAESLKLIEALASSAAGISEQMGAHLAGAASSQAALDGAARDYAATVSGLRGSVESSLATVESLHAGLGAQLERLQTAPQATLDAALGAVAAAAERLQEAIETMASKQEGAGRSVEAVSAELVTSLQSHNRQIEIELGRSREGASKFQDALVAAATRLAEQVEQASVR